MYRLFIIGIGLLFNASALADHSGKHLYDQNCATCHGFNGNGGVGVPLSLPTFLDSVPDDYLYKTIRNGRPGRIMPAFKALSDEEVKAIVDHVRSWSDKPAPLYTNTPVKGNAQQGSELFASHCAICHGADGQGGPGTGVTMSRPRSLPILAPALNNSGFLASATDEMIKHTLMKGREGTPMVSFIENGLSEQDINDIVAHIRGYESAAAESAAPSLKDEPSILVSESPYSVEETVDNLINAVESMNFRLIRLQDIESGVVEEGKEEKGQVIIYSCNFSLLNDALKIDPRIGLFLPCRVTVFQHNDKVLIMAANPKKMSGVFNNRELDNVCQEMKQVYLDMIDEALF